MQYYDMNQNKYLQHNCIRSQNNATTTIKTIKIKTKTQQIQSDEQILAYQCTSKTKYHLSNLHQGKCIADMLDCLH